MPADAARAFWIAAPGRGEIRPEPLPPPSADDVVVRTLFSGVSRGTEALVFQGRVPPTEYQRMRAPYQAGEFPAPIKYGYASVGRIERGPRELQDRTVFVLHPHQTRYVVPAQAVHVLPDDVPRHVGGGGPARHGDEQHHEDGSKAGDLIGGTDVHWEREGPTRRSSRVGEARIVS